MTFLCSDTSIMCMLCYSITVSMIVGLSAASNVRQLLLPVLYVYDVGSKILCLLHNPLNLDHLFAWQPYSVLYFIILLNKHVQYTHV